MAIFRVPDFLCALLLLNVIALAEPVIQPPAAWLAAQEQVWRTAGWTIEQPLADVVVGRAPNGDAIYVERLAAEEPLTRAAWRCRAVAGQRYPAPRHRLPHLMAGTMLYHGQVRALAEARGIDPFVALEQCFANMRKLGLNSAVYCAYTTPDEWPRTEELATQYGIDLIVQYHGAYYDVKRGPLTYRRGRLPKALAFLAAAHDSPRLHGFAIKEEIYLPALEDLQRTHAVIARHYPDVPIYTLYNSNPALAATRWPPPDIVGTDVYPFLGGYYGGGRQKPTFLVPQTALRHQLYGRLHTAGREAAKRGAAFTYTADMQAGSWLLTDEEMTARNIPLREFPGVEKLDNGRWLLWRRYRPPPIALAAGVWVAAACGAEGWFPWYYTPDYPEPDPIPEAPTEPYSWTPKDTGAAGDPLWQAYAGALAELRSYGPLRRQLVLDDFPRFATDDDWLLAGTFRFADDRPGHVVMVVNVDVGRWREYPGFSWDDSGLSVDRQGKLVGFTPLTEPRSVPFQLRRGAGETIVALDDGAVVAGTPTGSGSLHAVDLAIPPGSGRLLYIGPVAGAAAVRNLVNPQQEE